MSYATVDDFVETVTVAEATALARATLPATGYDEIKIGNALADASATLDSYFATRFPVPLSPVPRIVRAATITLAREALDLAGRDHVVKAADRVRKWAADVARGVATLGSAEAGETEALPASSGGPDVAAAPATFDPMNFSGYLPGCGGRC